MKIAYTVASSFSGSTLLSMILSAHPEVATISEFDAEGKIRRDLDYRCSCGRKIRECPFFLQLTETLRHRGVPFSVENMDVYLGLHASPRLSRWLSGKLPLAQSSGLERLRDELVSMVPRYRAEKERIQARNEAVMSAIMDIQGGSIFLDASKDPFRMRFLKKRHDLKAIYLFKNGISGAYSYYKRSRARRRPLSMKAASRRWFLEQITICRILKDFDRRDVLEISYSGLCGNVKGTLDRICRFLDLEPHPLDNFADVPSHIVGNATRLQRVTGIKEVADWQSGLGKSSVEDYRRVYRRYAKAILKANEVLSVHIWR